MSLEGHAPASFQSTLATRAWQPAAMHALFAFGCAAGAGSGSAALDDKFVSWRKAFPCRARPKTVILKKRNERDDSPA